MSLLRSIESRIAQIVEGAFGKLSRANVQPVELARRLVKEMDENQSNSVRKIYVPNIYDVYLATEDYDQFKSYETGLKAELSEYLAEHARRNGYSLLSRPRVELHVDDDLDTGAFGIATQMEGTPEPAAGAGAGVGAPHGSAAAAPPSQDPGATIIYRPEPEEVGGGLAREAFQLSGPDGTIVLSRRRSTIGRGSMCDVVVNDSSVSREHAEVVQQGTGYLVRDLGSTNGVIVNGSKVREQPLKPGDTILLGNTELRFAKRPSSTDGARA